VNIPCKIYKQVLEKGLETRPALFQVRIWVKASFPLYSMQSCPFFCRDTALTGSASLTSPLNTNPTQEGYSIPGKETFLET